MDSITVGHIDTLIRRGIGDQGRLLHVRSYLEQGRKLYLSDKDYVESLISKYLTPQTPESSPSISINSSDSQQSRYCANCGEVMNLAHNFCKNCGTEYKIQVETEYQIRYCATCGNMTKNGFCYQCSSKEHIPQDNQSSNKTVRARWYWLPILVGFIGGIIAYALTRKRNPKRARNMLIVGFIPSILYLSIMLIAVGAGLSEVVNEQNEIDTALDKYPDNIKAIKKIQLENCDNNMAYLQSEAAGDAFKERCIKAILGQ